MSRINLEWKIDFERGRSTRLGGIEDWMLMRRFGVLFSVVGALCATLLILAIPSFDQSFFVAYAVLAASTACLALVACFRAGTAMKFETGPRFLDIPRLFQAFKLAALLVFPCILLQIGYPLKIVLQYRSLTMEDVKPVADLVRLYDLVDRRISLATRLAGLKDKATDFVDPSQVLAAVDAEMKETRLLQLRIDVVFSAIDKLASRSSIARSLDLADDHARLKEPMAGRIAKLEEILTKLTKMVKGDPAAPAAIDEKLIAAYDKIATGLSCRYNRSEGCRLFDRLAQLWFLRNRSFGPDLFTGDVLGVVYSLPPSPAARDPYASYVLLFGWQGVLPVLIIATMFGLALRVIRLTDKSFLYGFGAVAIAFLWSFTYSSSGLLASQIGGGTSNFFPESLSVLIIGSAVLWLLMASHFTEDADVRRGSDPRGRNARALMIMLPTLVFLPLFYLARIGLSVQTDWLVPPLSYLGRIDLSAQADWLVAPYVVAGAGLIFLLVRRLDTRVVEVNCKPRTM